MSENPYAAPKADPSQREVTLSSDEMPSPYGSYRDIGVLQNIVLGLLGLISVLAVAQIYALIKLNQANRIPDEDPSSVERVDQAWTLSDQLENADIAVFFITVIFWCFWKNKSCKNAWAFTYRQRGREAIVSNGPTPGWAVGAYFVPILHLYKPFQAMAFIRNSISSRVQPPMLLGFWWTSWLLASNVGSFYLYLIGKGWIINEEELELEDLILYNQSLMIDTASYLVSCLIAAAVIYQLSVGQKRMARELKITNDQRSAPFAAPIR